MILFMALFSYVFDKLRRIAAHYSIRCNVFGDHGTRGHDSVFADRHAGQDGGACTNPGIFADVDGLANENLAVVEVVVVEMYCAWRTPSACSSAEVILGSTLCSCIVSGFELQCKSTATSRGGLYADCRKSFKLCGKLSLPILAWRLSLQFLRICRESGRRAKRHQISDFG